MLTADAEATLNTQEKIRVALRNVDRVITDNEVAVKDTLLNFETFTASLSGNGETDHFHHRRRAESTASTPSTTAWTRPRISSVSSAATNMAANCCRP